MKVKLLFLIAGLWLAVLPPAVWSQSKVGTTAASFLGIPVGARALGMGTAFTATANDVTALYWNPSGIAGLDKFSIEMMHSDWLADLKFDVVGVVLPIKDAGTLGAQVTVLSMPDQEITTTDQRGQDGTGIFYSAGSMCMGVSFARAFTDRFKLGLTAKYIREWIWHESASTVAVDIGSLYVTEFNGLRLGVDIANLGGQMAMGGRDLIHYHDVDETRDGNNARVLSSWNTDSWPLPMTLRFGMAMEAIQTKSHRLTAAVDAVHPNDNEESLNLGAEYAFREQFMLRAGYRSLFKSHSEEGLTLGAGVRQHLRGGLDFGFNFAYENFGRLNGIYKYSLAVGY
jgi:hypothetical protein